MPTVHKHIFENVDSDDHVFIWIQRAERPDVSIDLHNSHGRGWLSVRSEGESVGGFVVDTAWLEPAGEKLQRFCAYCGDELNLISSRPHVCDGEDF